MKNFIFFSIFFINFILINGYSNPISRENCGSYKRIQAERQTRIYENEIIEFIEKLRNQLKNEGLPEFGISSLDPLNLEEKRLQVNIENLANLDFNATLFAEGILGFEIEKLKIGLVGLKFDFIINWPVVLAKGVYGLDANTTLVPLKIFGNGDFDMLATNLRIVGTGNLNTRTVDGKLHIIIGKAEVDIQLEKFDFTITGVMGQDWASQIVSQALSLWVPDLLQGFKKEINDELAKLIEVINNWIINNTLGNNSSSILSCLDKD